MSSTSQDSPLPAPRRPRARRIAFAIAIVLVLVVIAIELGSRVADAVLASKKSDPAFDATHYTEGFLDKISLDALEFGTVKRAGEQSNARTGPHPYLGYALLPGFRTRPGAPQQASHNSLGFRGKETTWEKPAGVFRIVTTGGSSVYGQSESSDGAVWSQRLEDDLNASRPARRFEVINTGVPGWSSFEMLINLEIRALDFKPDLVIVYESINDMRCALYRWGGEPTRDNLQWRAPWVTYQPSALERRLAHSRTYLVWRRYLTNFASERNDLGFYGIKNYDPNGPDFYLHYANELPISDIGFDNYRRNLSVMMSVTTAHGAKMLLVTQAMARWHLDGTPSKNEQLDGLDRIQNIEREVSRERSIPLFECAKIIEEADEKELQRLTQLEIERLRKLTPSQTSEELAAAAAKHVRVRGNGLFKNEVHPTDAGSALIGKTIAEYLLGSDLLPK